MMGAPARVATLVLLLGLLLTVSFPAAAAPQSCGVAGATGIAAVGGFARYDLGSGIGGPAPGVDLTLMGGPRALPGRGVEARIGYRTVLLDTGPRPHLIRHVSALDLPVPGLPVSFCPTLHAAGSRVTIDGEPSGVVAAGLGLRLAGTVQVGGTATTPYAGVRGLAARGSGRVFGIDLAETGFSVGVEAGLLARLGRLTLRAAGTLDGLDDGLGLTPYPAAGLEIGAGIGF